jgi:hypothetical protein
MFREHFVFWFLSHDGTHQDVDFGAARGHFGVIDPGFLERLFRLWDSVLDPLFRVLPPPHAPVEVHCRI